MIHDSMRHIKTCIVYCIYCQKSRPGRSSIRFSTVGSSKSKVSIDDRDKRTLFIPGKWFVLQAHECLNLVLIAASKHDLIVALADARYDTQLADAPYGTQLAG